MTYQFDFSEENGVEKSTCSALVTVFYTAQANIAYIILITQVSMRYGEVFHEPKGE